MLLTTNPYQQYKTQGVMTASPMELVVMLYDGCVRQLRIARLSFEENNIVVANEALLKAQAIVQELSRSLDPTYPISAEINRLYEFVEDGIVSAIGGDKTDDLEALAQIMSDLRATWAEVARQTRANTLAVEE